MEDPIMKAILEDTSEIGQAEKRYGSFVADAEEKGLKQGIEQDIEL